jgi:hypothetical protein
MPRAKSVLASGTRIIGQVVSDGDLLVEGKIEGGPLRVAGCLTVAAGATVECSDAEVGEALVAGIFQGTLRARDVVRIHHSGRVVGDILATRVVFVSDQAAAAPAPRPAAPPPEPPAAPAERPQARPAQPSPPPSAPAPAAAQAPAAPIMAAAPSAAKPAARTTPAPAAPRPAAPAAAAPAAPRTIPTLPSLGSRAMERPGERKE